MFAYSIFFFKKKETSSRMPALKHRQHVGDGGVWADCNKGQFKERRARYSRQSPMVTANQPIHGDCQPTNPW